MTDFSITYAAPGGSWGGSGSQDALFGIGSGGGGSVPINNATGATYSRVNGPYGQGVVGSNGFIGPASAFLPPSISDPLAGRVAPDSILRFETWDGKVEAAGTPDQLIPQLQALLTVNHQRQGSFVTNNNTSNAFGPILVVPDNFTLSFPDDTSLTNYVYRSHDPLPVPPTPPYTPPPPTPAPPLGSNVPDSTLAGTFQDTLGRPAGPDDVASMRGSLQGGATVQDIRNYFAGSQEAKNTLWLTFDDVLNRPPEPDNMTGMQTTLVQGGSQAGVRTYLADSQEAKNDMWTTFDQVLGRPPDPNNLVGMQNMLAQTGAAQHDVRVFLASTQEAKNDVWSLFYNELGREAQQPDLDF